MRQGITFFERVSLLVFFIIGISLFHLHSEYLENLHVSLTQYCPAYSSYGIRQCIRLADLMWGSPILEINFSEYILPSISFLQDGEVSYMVKS